MPLKIRVPDRYAPTLSEFVQLPPVKIAALLKSLREEQPTLEVEELVQSLAERLALDVGKVREILQLLSSLVATRESYGASIDEFVEALRSAMEATGKEELRPDDWSTFQSAIGEALSSESAVSLSFKAIDLLNDHQRIYWNARVLTDLRPIFRAEVTEPPVAMVVAHPLKLTYREGDATKEFFVALDKIDVHGLITILGRALSKEESLRTLAEQRSFSILEIKS